ncbi:MAG TPA: anhydro-N-acetylmuramic acid kinase [Terriglobales bacterium]|nr:anhydro-N-acetylmuramic acid kinase [Terriglobales bacterium]
MIVAGVMSGTSADGIDVALVRVMGRGFRTRFEFLSHKAFPYPAPVRRAVLAAMDANSAKVADLARLNFLLAELYSEAILSAQRSARIKCELVGCHGQTLYHQGDAQSFLGRKLAVTWQTGEGSLIAARVGVPVVSDFRPADMAAGGKGAPLVPFLDYVLFRHRRRGRIVQNIGGIGNLTAIPPRAKPEQVIAFDTGPGNMVIDALAERLLNRRYDLDGKAAARGEPIERVIHQVLASPFFWQKPPRTAGREQFGEDFVRWFLRRCGRADKHDVLATATALTARTIATSVEMVMKRSKYRDFIVSGGGAKNATLMSMIEEQLTPKKLKIQTSSNLGLPVDAKEAVAFALLAYQTWRHQPSNIPSATGARRPAILGKVSYV